MSDFTDMLKADAYVQLVQEYERDGSIDPANTITGTYGPKDFGEDPTPFNSLYIEATDTGGFSSPNIYKTILTFTNLGHILPMEWTITRTIWDDLTKTILSTSTTTLTLVTTATFTCQTSGANRHAEFTATFKSPV
jgi:hypothetical protein